MEDLNKKKHVLTNVSLIYDEYNGIIEDLICFLTHSYSIGIKCENKREAKNDNLGLGSFKNLNQDSNVNIENEIKESKLVIFIATNDSVKSERCNELIKLTHGLKIPIISYIIEEIKDIKSTVLSRINHNFEVYKDRVYDDKGYDPYIQFGDCFQKFIKRIKLILKHIVQLKRKRYSSRSCFFSYSITSDKSSKCISDIIKIFKKNVKCRCIFMKNLYNDKNTEDNLYQSEVIELLDKQDLSHDYYYYLLKKGNHDKHLNASVAILKLFDDIMHDVEVIGASRLEKNWCIKQKKRKDTSIKYPYNEEDIVNEDKLEALKESLGHRSMSRLGWCRSYHYDSVQDYFIESMNKHGISLELLDQILSYVEFIEKGSIFKEFFESKIIVFLLTKDYYESKKFQKIYFEAKRLNKIVFMVKLQEFDFNINDGYEQVFIYDVSKHEECNYEGYLTKRLVNHATVICNVSTKDLKYNLHYDLFICTPHRSVNNNGSIENLKSILIKNIKIKCKFDIIESDERILDIQDYIEKSKIIVFCLTNDYWRSDEFKDELNLAKTTDKSILFLLMEEIESNDFNAFNVTKMYNTHDEGEAFYKLCYFVYLLLDSKQSRVSYENGKVELKPIDSGYQPEKYLLYRNHPLVKKRKIITKINVEDQYISDVAYIKHLKEYIFLTEDFEYHYDENFLFKSKVTRPNETSDVCESILYDEKTRNSYLVREYYRINRLNIQMCKENKIEKELSIGEWKGRITVRLLNDRIFILEEKKILIYDLNLELVTNIPLSDKDKSSYYEHGLFVKPHCKNYVFLVNHNSRKIKALNTNGLKFNENMDLSYNEYSDAVYCKQANNLVIIRKKNTGQNISEVEYENIGSVIHNDLNGYICQLNEYPPHLLKHPYVLPCGSFACLECIYENYNLYLDNFICAACGNNEHQQLENQLVKSSLIADNLRKISEKQLEHLKLQNLECNLIKDGYENIESIFKFFEEEIELRVESLKIELDNLKVIQLNLVDSVEQKLLKKISRKNKKEINEISKIGTFKFIKGCQFKFNSALSHKKVTVTEDCIRVKEIGLFKF